jgi:hypothetical protein
MAALGDRESLPVHPASGTQRARPQSSRLGLLLCRSADPDRRQKAEHRGGQVMTRSEFLRINLLIWVVATLGVASIVSVIW